MSSEDYLDVDKPIPGQNYVCMSFVSPDNIVKQKELFIYHQFINQQCQELTTKIDEITKESSDELKNQIKTKITDELSSYLKFNYNEFKSSLDDFKYKFNDELDTRFNKISNNKTSIRGVKVRGVYDNYRDAENRAKVLQRKDRSFHVFVGQVGYWLPWDPVADKVESEEYLEEELNSLMKEYKKNEVNKDIFYEEQKREKIKDDMIKLQKHEEEQKKITDSLDEPDPWLQSKFPVATSDTTSSPEETTTTSSPEEPSTTSSPEEPSTTSSPEETTDNVKVV
jgi:hypothetical protein